MRRLSDVFYVNAKLDENYFIYYGMEFKEFIKFNPINIKNILITDGCFLSNNFNGSWYLETANGNDNLLELCEEDIYRVGNFHWVDYNNETDLNSCLPEERAEVLYLSHFAKPIKSPFFDRINNEFFYLAHDDGWFCKLFCRDMSVFKDIIANKITDTFSKNKRRKIYPICDDIKDEMFELTSKGLLIDFSDIQKDEKSIRLNFYTIGEYGDMDEMYNNLERNKRKAIITGTLEHKNKKWKIHYWDK